MTPPLSGSSFETFGDDKIVILGDEFALLVRALGHLFLGGRILFRVSSEEQCLCSVLACIGVACGAEEN